MSCQICGCNAPTKNVEFRQNVGALIMRFHKTLRGELCKSCINQHFWKMTLITLFLGPWGVISLIMTPIFIIMNTVQYLSSLSLPAAYPTDQHGPQ